MGTPVICLNTDAWCVGIVFSIDTAVVSINTAVISINTAVCSMGTAVFFMAVFFSIL